MVPGWIGNRLGRQKIIPGSFAKDLWDQNIATEWPGNDPLLPKSASDWARHHF
jgi:hypothetical protein